MKLNQFIQLGVIALLFITSGQACDIDLDHFTSKDGRDCRLVQVHVTPDQSYHKLKNFFVKNFVQSYQHLDLAQLNPQFKNQDDLSQHLSRSFDNEMRLINNDDKKFWIVRQRHLDTCIGLMFVEDQSSEYARLPQRNYGENDGNKIAHIRQLLVKSDLTKCGIGGILVKKIQSQYSTTILDARRINENGKNFYKHLGFIEQDVPYDSELNSDQYCGFLWQKSE